MISILKTKIQELTVDESSLDYPGSISIPRSLVIAAGLNEFEQVFVNNKTSGARISTYIVFSKNEGFVSINGAAAHHFKKGDKIHVLAYKMVNEHELENYKPIIVITENNLLIEAKPYLL